MIILGIDPGLIRTGYGIIDAAKGPKMKLLEAGVITTDARDGITSRLHRIFRNIDGLIKQYSPGVIVIEKLYAHYKHPTTALLMGHARGVVCLAAGINDLRLVSYGATRIKKAVTGNGRASKQQVQRTVQAFLGLKKAPEPVDISDALSMGISFVFIEGIGPVTSFPKNFG
ncbi:MAG: crossover junction endodeoxyribonuclease RuvC [Candidatus Omnitrophica bacterium]|nr:crossover junction endodeoxyribonuclease RuvC [Candidatus Omnitrophota bacterium]